MKTYGSVQHHPAGDWPSARSMFEIRAEPQIVMRLKRIFPRVFSESRAGVHLTDTPEMAKEVLWVIDRWPMVVDPATHAHLTARAQAFDDRAALVNRVLAGYQPPLGEGAMGMGIDLRDYQAQARDLAWETGALLLADPLGLGKTFSGLSTLARPELLPAAVIVPTVLPAQWAASLHRIFPLLRFHIAKSTKPVETDADVIILNWAKLPGWARHLAGRVRTLLLDEAQELRTGPGTARYSAATWIREEVELVMGLTATPVYNWGIEVWNLMNLIAPDVLGSETEFVREWCSGGIYDGKKRKVDDPAALGAYLRDQGVMLRRTRKEVGRELPALEDPVIDVELDHKAFSREARDLDVAGFATKLLSASTPVLERGQAAREMDWRLRQATGIAKSPQVAAFTRMLLESGEKVVLVGWHRAVYALWNSLLEDANPVYLTGSESPTQKQESLRRFIEGDSQLLIGSLRSGAGIDGLQEVCHLIVFGELDWSPGVHEQWVGRLLRDGMDEAQPVVAYYVVADEGSDPTVADTLELKRQQSEPFVDPERQLFVPRADPADRLKTLAKDYLSRSR